MNLPPKLRLALGLGLAFTLAACSKPADTAGPASGSPAPQQKLVFKLAHVQPESHAFHKGSAQFAESLKRLSNGQIEVQIFPNGVMGNERDLLESLQIGSMDFTTVTSALTAKFDAAYQAFSLPFLFDNFQELFTTIDKKEVQDRLAKGLTAKGIHPLGYWIGGSRSYYGTSPINTMADFRGKKVRTLEDPYYLATWQALGGIPTPLPFGEVFTGLQSKLVDGAEGAINTYVDKKFYEAAPNVAMINYIFSVQMFHIAESSWKKLSPEQQGWVLAAAKEATEAERKVVLEEDKNLDATLTKLNVNVTRPPIEPMRAAVQPVYEKFKQQYGPEAWAFVEQIRK